MKALLCLLAALSFALVCPRTAGAAGRPPNVLLIVADDMGFSDAGCYGGEIATPRLDRLAADGLRFTQFYNTARCWPSRAAIMTGYYAQQVRRDTVPGVPSGGNGVRPPWAHLLPEMLRPLGYGTYHSGKWHIDGPRLKAGFDRSYCVEDYDRHFYPRLQFEDDRKLPPVKPGDGYYSTTAIADRAIQYLREHAERHAGEPFFEYLAFISPHFPVQAPAEDIARQKGRYDDGWDEIRTRRWKRQRELGIVNCALPDRDPDTVPSWNLPEAELQKRIGPGEVGRAVAWEQLTPEQKRFQAAKMEVHAAMVDRIDREIGRVLDQLDAMKAADDTLVLFLSDNGASAEQIIRGDGHDPAAAPGSPGSFLGIGPGWSTACNTPLRLHKSWVHEGGISTPLIVRWPKGIAARGELRHNPGHLIDLAPTILELAGGHWPVAWGDAKVPPPPGKSLAPVFARDGTVSHDYFWWFHEGNRAVRVGDWKLVSQFSAGKERPWELYDLAADRCEMNDLAARQPERVKEMGKAWADHMAEFKALAKQGLPAKAREVPDEKND